MLLVSYIQQYFNTSITVLTNQVWKFVIALFKVPNTGAFTVIKNSFGIKISIKLAIIWERVGLFAPLVVCELHQGRIQDFYFGLVQTVMCAHTHHERKAHSPNIQPKVQGQRNGYGSSRVLDAVSCYLSLIFEHSDTKWDLKTMAGILDG